MNGIEKALISAVKWLEKQRIPYMVIGGMARSLYGIPRQTLDVDIKIILETDEDAGRFIREIPKSWRTVPEDPVQFLDETMVLPVKVGNIKVDLVRAMLPYEKEAVARSRVVISGKTRIRVSTPDDLIIQKSVSTRQKDWFDIEDIARRFRKEIDWKTVIGLAKDLSKQLDRSDLLKRIEKIRDES